jgi:hypothetical protein
MSHLSNTHHEYISFFSEVKERIRRSQYNALKSVNKELIQLYWDIGQMIVDKQEELGWGKSVVEQLSKDILKAYPGIKGFSTTNLWNMRLFYNQWFGQFLLKTSENFLTYNKFNELRV